MPSKVNVLGHSVHPMLVAFPIGLLALVPVFDIAHFATGSSLFAQVAFWMLTCGAAGGLLAAVPGLIDWTAIPSRTRAQRIGLTHMLVNVSAVGLYILSWIVRLTGGIERAGAGSFVLAVAGLCLMLVGGWLGGELVERLGVGVDRNANVDAPSSLARGRQGLPHGTRPSEPQPV
jgi:uncharacterized membrane protein